MKASKKQCMGSSETPAPDLSWVSPMQVRWLSRDKVSSASSSKTFLYIYCPFLSLPSPNNDETWYLQEILAMEPEETADLTCQDGHQQFHIYILLVEQLWGKGHLLPIVSEKYPGLSLSGYSWRAWAMAHLRTLGVWLTWLEPHGLRRRWGMDND